MGKKPDPINVLARELTRKEKRQELEFNEYLELVKKNPKAALRSIFQLFYDMVDEYVEQKDDTESDPESIGFVRYDCSRLFVEGADNPFFADTPFANRFVRQAAALKQGTQQNRVYVYDGPSGCGKSTFLNNILRSFELYTNTPAGRSYEIVWRINGELLGHEGEELTVACPSHDYPILMIPKNYRKDFLKNLLPDGSAIKKNLFSDKEYAWVFQAEPCTVCRSIFWALFNELGNLEQVLNMVFARAVKFDRRTGDGISVFNPGDKPFSADLDSHLFRDYYTNRPIQEKLDQFFGPNVVKYAYSPLAKTNNGIYALMDVKAHNKERLLDLHNIISEGVHRVGDIEERINSLFFALMNPEDKEILKDANMESFRGRIQENNVSYVLEPETEANIFRNIFGRAIDDHFLPRVLENFAKVIIASRMNRECEPQQEWISDMDKYKLYCDKDGLLLRMELYSNNIPSWLSEKDKKSFTAPVRKEVIAEGQKEGLEGFSGRDSIELFRDFYSAFGERETLINMSHVIEFFKHGIGRERRNRHLPPRGFLDSLVNSYDYAVLNEVKEALYFFSKKQMEKDILNYLCATNYDIGDIAKCEHTGDEFEVTAEFLIRMAKHFTGNNMVEKGAMQYATGIQKKYLPIRAKSEQKITETPLYEELYNSYMQSLKERVLDPLVSNESFPEAVKVFGSEEFDAFDTKLKDRVSRLITNLENNFGYSRQGAKEICLYVLEKDLVDKFS